MPQLQGLHEQIQRQLGEVVRSPEDKLASHVKAITEAIQGVQLNIEAQEGYDYTPEVQALGEAVVKALRAHGTNLTKALNKLGESLTVNVEAPVVTVEAPEVNAVFELPEQPAIDFDIRRDSSGRLAGVTARPVTQQQPEAAYEME